MSALVGRLVHLAVDRAADAREASHGLRVGIDAAVSEDGRALADAVASALAREGMPVARVRQEGFLRPRSLRLELGADDPDAE